MNQEQLKSKLWSQTDIRSVISHYLILNDHNQKKDPHPDFYRGYTIGLENLAMWFGIKPEELK